ncbi:methyltransferase family protein [Pseudobacter ginsenosidimutans]|uniref:Methyltransferase family protein n=2 Tax=Pseudobacter ginsenosidimutans TaxID=661488 RepID=A0A4Q7MVY3_9BACT|nr:methyltransferase family protein [Pseudobacter ginsenosidimutans]
MDNNFEKVSCALCGLESTINVTKKGQFGILTYVSICKNCGLMYLNPRWTSERYKHFYIHEYEKYYPRVPGVKENEFANIKLIVDRINRHHSLRVSPGHVLDIGVGFGESLLYLKKNVYQQAGYSAIEPSKVCVDYLQEQGIQVISNSVDTDWTHPFEQKFDLVIMRHVAEHLLQPVDALKKIAKVLSDRGILYLAVPDAYHPVLPLTSYYFRTVHTYYFNKDTISELMEQSGLQIEVLQDNQKGELYLIAKRATGKTAVRHTKAGYYKQYYTILKGLVTEKIGSYRKNLIYRMRNIKKSASGSR